MKKSLFVAGILLAGSTLVASDEYFVGMEFGNTKSKINWTQTYIYQSDLYPNHYQIGSGGGTGSGNSQGIKLGTYIGENNKVAIFYLSSDIDGVSGESFGIQYDHLIGHNKLKPFVGVTIGEGLIEDNDSTFKGEGIIYGMQLGLNYEIDKYFSIDTGYRFLKTDIEYSIYQRDYGESGTASTLTNGHIKEIKNWYFGLNYKF
mgnify:CR=1 FL=1